jgi:phosphopantothenoylcysteine decarboxylase/phosphopantothenate--cysteine ligase
MNDQKQPTILVGVGGGIAAYKTVDVVSKLRQAGASLHVAMTESAVEFVTPLTFAAVSDNKVLTQMFQEEPVEERQDIYPHLYPATEADYFILAPATANLLSRIASGRGDDLVTTCVLSLPSGCRKYFCPAMNVEMWDNEAVQTSTIALEEMGWTRLGPDAGMLACGAEGSGRMAQPEEIVDTILRALHIGQQLENKRVLILSGPTREHFDPVRFIGNASSGRMGKALADEAAAVGATVDFITGPVGDSQIPRAPRILVHSVQGAEEMLAQAADLFNQADVVIYAAAVADYTPAERSAVKKAKSADGITLELRPTPDIAATLNVNKRSDQVCIGFALQTHNGEDEAREKMRIKQFDGIILNHMDALGSNTGSYDFLPRTGFTGEFSHWGKLSKRACARRIFEEATQLMGISSAPISQS